MSSVAVVQHPQQKASLLVEIELHRRLTLHHANHHAGVKSVDFFRVLLELQLAEKFEQLRGVEHRSVELG